MEFDPKNPIVRLCLQAMGMEEAGKSAEASALFTEAWNEAANDSEKFISAHFLARVQEGAPAKLEWLQTALHFALKINDATVQSAFPSLYSKIATCYEELGMPEKAREAEALAASAQANFSDQGPFYHGTKADLKVGNLLTAGGKSNYQPDLLMNHIYFTALVNGAGLAAALANGDGPERVYIVEPTGPVENDPNVTDKKFPGNPTRSYRSRAPLRIVGEAKDWAKQTPEDIRHWREKLSKSKGEIVN
jgi:rifampin ADP-ribosylating transferase